jgi:3-methyladenine DNA glycosylase AlkC
VEEKCIFQEGLKKSFLKKQLEYPEQAITQLCLLGETIIINSQADKIEEYLDGIAFLVDGHSFPEDGVGLNDVLVPLGKYYANLLATNQSFSDKFISSSVKSLKPHIRCAICYTVIYLGQNHPEELEHYAYQLAKDEDWRVREFIANAYDDLFSECQEDYLFELMKKWVKDPNEYIRRVPTNALLKYGRKNMEKVLVLMEELLHDQSEYVKKNVYFCLQQISKSSHPILKIPNPSGPDILLKWLVKWAEDDNQDCKWILANTLGNVWAKNHIPAALMLLERISHNSSTPIQTVIVNAVKTLAKYDKNIVTQKVDQWLIAKDPSISMIAIKTQKKLK